MQGFDLVEEIFRRHVHEYEICQVLSEPDSIYVARGLQQELEENGVNAALLRILSHSSCLDFKAGKRSSIHDIVIVDGVVLDPMLKEPVYNGGVKAYLNKALKPMSNLEVSSLTNGSVTTYKNNHSQ